MSGTLYNPAVEQMVQVWSDDDSSSATDGINDLLREGWQVVSVTGAGAGNEYSYGICFFVVLERRRS